MKPLLALLFTVAIWGLAPAFTRSLSLDLGPADHLVIRYGLVAILYLAGLAVIGGWRIAKEDWPRLLFISLIGMMGYNFGAAFGFERVSAGVGGLIIGTQPLLIALFAAAVARERLSGAGITGLALAFIGTGVLFWPDISKAGTNTSLLTGAAMIFGGGSAWALYVVLAKPLILKYGAYPISAISISIAALAMVTILGSRETFDTIARMSTVSWLEMLYMILFSTFVSTITWNYGAARVTSTAAGASLYLVPVLAVISGALLLGESITVNMLTGGALILAGVAFAQFMPAFRQMAALGRTYCQNALRLRSRD